MINLITKYLPKMQERFQQRSFTAGKAANDYEFVGAKTIRILSMVSNPPVNFNRTGSGNRFGSVSNVQDTMQEMTLTQDKAFTGTIDRGDNSQQGFLKKASAWLKLQQDEQMIPMVDKYNLAQWAFNAGVVVDAGATISKSNIVDKLLDLEVELDDRGVTPSDRWCYVANSTYKMFRLASEFVGCDGITDKLILKGYKGDLGTLKIVTVPKSYLPANCVALVATKACVLAPTTLTTARILETVQGFDGPVIEGRRIYDAFVKGEISDGVAVLAESGKKAAKPTLTAAGKITPGTSDDYVMYTIDGTDPRYSTTAVKITAETTPAHTAGDTIKAVSYQDAADGVYHSDVASIVTTS